MVGTVVEHGATPHHLKKFEHRNNHHQEAHRRQGQPDTPSRTEHHSGKEQDQSRKERDQRQAHPAFQPGGKRHRCRRSNLLGEVGILLEEPTLYLGEDALLVIRERHGGRLQC